MASKCVNEKRNGCKQRRRSKSVIIDDILTYKDPKISKWTKVKAAFKWFVYLLSPFTKFIKHHFCYVGKKQEHCMMQRVLKIT